MARSPSRPSRSPKMWRKATLQTKCFTETLVRHAGNAGALFLRQFEPLQLEPVALNVCKVVLSLLHKPALFSAAENLR